MAGFCRMRRTVSSWMEDYNIVHPHSRLGYCSPREYILSQPSRVRFNGVNYNRHQSPSRLFSPLEIRLAIPEAASIIG
jgi:hypothetical protein